MKRTDYLKPTMKVVQLKHQCQILAGSSYEYETTGSGRTSITEMEDAEEL